MFHLMESLALSRMQSPLWGQQGHFHTLPAVRVRLTSPLRREAFFRSLLKFTVCLAFTNEAWQMLIWNSTLCAGTWPERDPVQNLAGLSRTPYCQHLWGSPPRAQGSAGPGEGSLQALAPSSRHPLPLEVAMVRNPLFYSLWRITLPPLLGWARGILDGGKGCEVTSLHKHIFQTTLPILLHFISTSVGIWRWHFLRALRILG